VILSAQDYMAKLVARYGWVNQAVPGADLRQFVDQLVFSIARFPPDAIRSAS
jgi:hypothetical protein